MENQKEVQIFIYRGIEGFTFFRNIPLPNYAKQMTSLVLPPKIEYKCDKHYLVIQIDNALVFMGIKIDGNCGLSYIQCKDVF